MPDDDGAMDAGFPGGWGGGHGDRLPSFPVTSQQRRWILCGGLASGKSQVRRLLERLGIETIDADTVGHEVLESTGAAFADVAARWPDAVVAGEVDRRWLASVVFDDPAQLRELESITHPHIFDRIRDRVEEIPGPVFVEMPLLHHSLGPEWSIAVVDARDEVRLGRAIDRGMEENDARARMKAQPSRSQWLAAADLVIPNHGELGELETAVERVGEAL